MYGLCHVRFVLLLGVSGPMNVYRGAAQAQAERGAVLTIGTFDGVHLGHQAVLRELTGWALNSGAPAGVITFAQHPRKILDGRAPDLLTSVEHRLVLFQRAGVAFTWVLDFTPELSKWSAEDFARQVLVGKLGCRGLTLGFDSRFGHDRIGTDSPELPQMAKRLGFEIRCLQPVLTPDGQPISSTLIRDAIWDGRLHDAEALLGRRVSVYGTVVAGEARGRRLGFRTANLDLGREVRPPFGVYVTIAEVEGQRHGSVTNVGYRPTVSDALPQGVKPDLLLETHLFDFDADLYGKKIEVSFVEKLRDERRFPDVQALAEQIKKDSAKARGILQALGL